MRVTVVALLVGVVGPVDGAIFSSSRTEEIVSRQFTVNPGARLSIENTNGSILIEGVDGREVELVAVKRARREVDLDRLEIVVEESPDALRIETRRSRSLGLAGFFRRSDSGSVDYTIKVPRGMALDAVKSVNGAIEITDMTAMLLARTVNGRVRIRNAAGPVDAATTNGSVEVEMGGPLLGETELRIKTVNGAIKLFLTGTPNAEISARTVNGSISNPFDLRVERKRGPGQSLEATLGDGVGRIELETVNGAIRIDSR